MNGSTHTKSSSTQQPSQLPSDAAAADDSEATAAAFLAAISTQALKPTARKSVGRPRGTKVSVVCGVLMPLDSLCVCVPCVRVGVCVVIDVGVRFACLCVCVCVCVFICSGL